MVLARGLIAPDEKTFAYINGRPKAPKGADWDKALEFWKTLYTDEGAHFDTVVTLDAASLPPIVSWGTSPENVTTIDGSTPDPDKIEDEARRNAVIRALDYMGLKPNTKMTDVALDRVSSAPAPTDASRICALLPAS